MEAAPPAVHLLQSRCHAETAAEQRSLRGSSGGSGSSSQAFGEALGRCVSPLARACPETRRAGDARPLRCRRAVE